MLPQRYRLQRATDVQRVRRHGRSWRHPLAILLVLPAGYKMNLKPPVAGQNGLPPSRFAFAASRRVGSAVVRNRAKRLLREAVRIQLDEIEPGWDCLLIARQGTAEAPFAEVKTAIFNLFTRAQLFSSSTHRAGSQRNLAHD